MTHQTVRSWDHELVPSASGRTRAPVPTCPVEAALKVVGRRWSTLILRELLQGPLSYSEVKAALPTLSDKVLSERLSELTAWHVLERDVARGYPRTVTYRLTERGRAMRPLLIALYDAGEVLLSENGTSPRTARP